MIILQPFTIYHRIYRSHMSAQERIRMSNLQASALLARVVRKYAAGTTPERFGCHGNAIGFARKWAGRRARGS